MAEEEDLLGSMDDLGDEEGEEEESGEGSPLMRYLPLIGVVLVVQIIIGYAIGAWFFGGSDGEAVEGEEMVSAAQMDIPEQKEVIWDKLDPIVVNPAGTGAFVLRASRCTWDCPRNRFSRRSRKTSWLPGSWID